MYWIGPFEAQVSTSFKTKLPKCTGAFAQTKKPSGRRFEIAIIVPF